MDDLTFGDRCPRALYMPGTPGVLRGPTHLQCRLRQGHDGEHRAPLLKVTEIELDEMRPESAAMFTTSPDAAVAWTSGDG